MFLIQQSSSFRLWTSRALMVYFRRALLFLVVSPRQNPLSHRFLTGEQAEPKICFSDAEDDEETMINSKSEMKLSLVNQQEDSLKQINQSRENDMRNSPGKNRSDQSLVIVDFPELPNTEQLKPLSSDSNVLPIMVDHASQYYRSEPSSRSQNFSALNRIDPILPSPIEDISAKRNIVHPLQQIYALGHRLSDSAISSSSSDDEDDIYEKYQTSFSHILHPTKSLHANRAEKRLHSTLILEPNTSIITVRPLPSHSFHRNTIDYSIFTNHVSVRLIAYQTDRIIPGDLQPIGCRKHFVNSSHIPIKINEHHSIRLCT